jgi:hypothetical protein
MKFVAISSKTVFLEQLLELHRSLHQLPFAGAVGVEAPAYVKFRFSWPVE